MDLVLVLLFVLTGLALGFLSLYLRQSLVAHRVLSLPADFRPALVAGLFSVFVFLTYVLLCALTHLQPVPAKVGDRA